MAAAKQSYKIPYDLNQSYGDINISLQTKDGSVGKVVPIKAVLTYVGSFFVCFFLLMNTFIGSMSTIFQKVLFVILWVALTILLAQYDATRRMNVQLVPVIMQYLPASARKVLTRTKYNAMPFYQIVGIESISEDGLVEFYDGSWGYWYRVVGSASVLLFDADRDAIITRVDNFFRKWKTDAEIVFMTTKEAQKVYRQVAALQKRYQNLQSDNQDLRDLAEEQFRILKNYVGSEFKSIHQYMFIRGRNKEALQTANNILQQEVESSSLMIKQCVPLEYEDVCKVYASIYQKGDS